GQVRSARRHVHGPARLGMVTAPPAGCGPGRNSQARTGGRAMRNSLRHWRGGLVLVGAGLLVGAGGEHTPIDVSEFGRGPAPLREPGPASGPSCCYEDSLTGGQIFDMYCSYCHNPRNLAERPFANYQNAVVHMRVRANLTGKEYAKLMAW